jgi:hypothetical protein
MPPAKGFEAADGMSTSLCDILNKLTIPDLRYLAFLMEMPYNEALKKTDNKLCCNAWLRKLRHPLRTHASPLQRGFIPSRSLVSILKYYVLKSYKY